MGNFQSFILTDHNRKLLLGCKLLNNIKFTSAEAIWDIYCQNNLVVERLITLDNISLKLLKLNKKAAK